MDTVVELDPADQGRVIEHEGVAVLRFERSVGASPEEVWRAFTESDATAAWAFPLTFQGGKGGTVSFDYGEYGTITGEVLGWEEPRVLEYAWRGQEGRWHVCVMLDEADDGGTRLTFDHLGPDPHHPDFAAGWHWHLDRLEQYLAGQTPAAVMQDEHFEELQRLYAHSEG